MNTTVVARNGNGHPPAAVVENVVIRGDLGKLTEQQRTDYYLAVCKSIGLNPLTKPFDYLTLNGRLVLYATRACTDQLRAIYKVSVVDLIESERDGVFVITAKMQNGEGRIDMAKGAVTIANLKGDMLANAIMKAETKAKRRATLSLCGLGFLDETEIETIPQRQNPHTARASDEVDVPTLDDPDRVPLPSEAVQELPKMEQRPVADKLGKELAALKTLDEVLRWKNLPAVSYRVWQLRHMWRETFQGRVKEKLMALRTEQEFQPPHDPETGEVKTDALAEIDRVLSMVVDPGMLEKVFAFQCEPRIEPHMYDDAMAILRKHEARLS